jgi:hypothetical protein
LIFSKIEAGKLVLKTILMQSVFERVSQVNTDTARAKGLSLTLKSIPVCRQHCSGDALRIGQVLLTTGNAIKFTAQGGVQVATTEQEFDGERPSGYRGTTIPASASTKRRSGSCSKSPPGRHQHHTQSTVVSGLAVTATGRADGR